MKIGIVLSTGGDGRGPAAWTRVSALAQRAEAAGLDSIWFFDHLLYRSAGREEGFHEATAILAAAAAITERVELGTLVLATSFRPPALLAKMAATIDAVSAGRLILGLGCGWNEAEYRAFGYPFDHRVSRFEECLNVIAPLVQGRRVTYHGRWTHVEDAVLLPPPERAIPILVAAKGSRMLGLTAARADAWNTAWYGHPDERFRQRLDDLHAACTAEGRDPATVEVTVGVEIAAAGPDAGTVGPDTLPADAAEVAGAFAEWAGRGVRHVQIRSPRMDERLLEVIAEAKARG